MIICNYVVIRIKAFSPNKVIKLLKKMGINLYNIKLLNDELLIKVKASDLCRIEKLYNFEIVSRFGLVSFLFSLKYILYKSVFVFFFFLFANFFSSFVVRININSSDTNLRNRILLFLENEDVYLYHMHKSDDVIDQIKIKVMDYFRDELEWINIERRGMIYNIQIQDKVIKNSEESFDRCNIVAKKDGIISRIISSTGDNVLGVNDSVKTGDLIITGEIKANDEVKASICATGKVYAKTWYTVDISIPKFYEKTNYLDKKRYNFLLSYNNKSIKVFKDRLDQFTTFKKKIVNLFGVSVFLSKDVLVSKDIVYYDEIELEKKIDDLILEKMKPVIGEDGIIVKRNVLKKNDNDSKIDIELFIVAEEEIGRTILF